TLPAQSIASLPSSDRDFVRARRGALVGIFVLAALGLAALPLDLPVARWFHDGHCPGEVMRCLAFGETYAPGFGVCWLVLSVFAPDGRRSLLPRAVALSLGAGLLANIVKLLVVRTRPHEFDLAAGRSVLETFGQWLPVRHVVSGEQSFPSAHM